jgi:hypothetical protein
LTRDEIRRRREQKHDRADAILGMLRARHVNAVLIEDASSGMGLIQMLREETSLNVIAQQPKGDKRTRMSRHEGRFEAGHILLPRGEPPGLPSSSASSWVSPTLIMTIRSMRYCFLWTTSSLGGGTLSL